MKRSSIRSLKHPILKQVEYASITKNGKRVLEIPGQELENKTWREFTIYIGEKLPAGKYGFTIKFKNSAELYSGTTRAVSLNPVDVSKDLEINKEIEDLKKLVRSKNDFTNMDSYLAINNRGYELEIKFLERQVQKLETEVTDLENENEDLTEDLIQAKELLDQSKQKNEYMQYLPGMLKLLQNKYGLGTDVSLENSNQSDIPAEILQILGLVDYSRIDPESLQKIISALKQYISVLPLKGK